MTGSDLDKHEYLITDGAVSNNQDVVNLIRSYKDHFNVHTVGIGNGASKTLVIECANAGNGSYYFVNNRAEGLQGKVIDALKKSFKPYVKFSNNEIFIEGNKYIEMPDVKSIKKKVFNGDYFTYCAIVNELADEKLKNSVDFSFTRSDNGKEERTVIDFDEHLRILEGDSIFKIIANSYINDKKIEKPKEEIIEASIKYQVPSVFTAFFAAEKLEEKYLK
jgi:Ca-activated chloride channel homolog